MVDIVHTGLLELSKSLTGNKGWAKRFFVLKSFQSSGTSTLEYYKDAKKDFRKQEPKGVLNLVDNNYQVEIVNSDVKCNGKRFVFDVRTVEATYRLAADSRADMDRWLRHLQMQAKLKPTADLGISYNVQPLLTEANKRIGAAGECTLHMSKAGIKLALHPSASLVAEWPLKCIRCYACDEGKFNFEVGRKAPLGEGLYVFETMDGDSMFNVLDYLIKAEAGQLVRPPPELQHSAPTPGYHHLQHNSTQSTTPRPPQGPPPEVPRGPPPGSSATLPLPSSAFPRFSPGAGERGGSVRVNVDNRGPMPIPIPEPASEYNVLDHGKLGGQSALAPPQLLADADGAVYNTLMPQVATAAGRLSSGQSSARSSRDSAEMREYGNAMAAEQADPKHTQARTTPQPSAAAAAAAAASHGHGGGPWRRLSGPESVARDYDQLQGGFVDDMTPNKFYGQPVIPM